MTKLVNEDTLEKTVPILKAIAHPVRLQIVNILKNGESQVSDLVNALGELQSYTSQQLGILKLSGVLKSKRDGNKVYYFLANDNIKRIVKSIMDEI